MGRIFKSQHYSGAIIWKFADCRVHEEWSAARPNFHTIQAIERTV